MLLHFKILFQCYYEMLHIWDHLQNLLYFENQTATSVGIREKLLLFETQIATFVGISKKIATFLLKVLHFLGNLKICYFYYI